MISEVITIDGQEVKVRVSASLPRLYRAKFQRDLFVDLKRLQKVKDSNEDLTDLDCEVFENIAFIMARHGDSENTPKDVGEWLDSFNDPLAVYKAFEDVLRLWGLNAETQSESKKNTVRPNDK